MPPAMDHIADVARGGVELYRLAKLYALPDFVKSAKQDVNFQVPANTTPAIYADPVRQQFPCHTKASTWLSALFYQEKRAEFHPKEREQIERRLNSYVDYFGIRSAVDAVKARWAELHKDAESKLPDTAYAYVWEGENGTKERRLPLRSAMEVKAAAEWLERYRDQLPYATRRTVATKILTKAAAFGAAIGGHVEFLERQAGQGVCDPDEVVEMIQKRALMVPADSGAATDEQGNRTGGLRDRFTKMAETVKTTPRQALQPGMLVKLAETVDQLDRMLGLVGKYAPELPRPEDVLFKVTRSKMASELVRHVATTTGELFEKAQFKKLAVDDLRSLFGDEFAARITTPLGELDVEKMAEEVATLPRPDSQLLVALLSERGVTPALRKAASARRGLDHAEFVALANQL